MEPAGLLPQSRLCILCGTLLAGAGGYAEVLGQAPEFSTVSVHSLRFGGSISFAYWSDRVDFSQFDVCLLDFDDGDSASVAQGVLGAEDVGSALRFALVRLIEAGCMPVLLLPEVQAESRDAVLRVARQCRIPVFDMVHTGAGGETQDALGKALAAAIGDAWGLWKNSAERIPVARPGHVLSFLPVERGAAGRATFTVGPDDEVVGVVLGRLPDGDISVEGQTTDILAFERAAQDVAGDPETVCVPCAPVLGLDGHVSLGPIDGESGLQGVIVRRPAELTCIARLPFPWRLDGAAPPIEDLHGQFRFGAFGTGAQLAIDEAAGWSGAENSLRCTEGGESEFEVAVPEGQQITRLTFLAAPFIHTPQVPAQLLSIVAGGHVLASFSLSEPWMTRLTADVPEGLFAPGTPARFKLLHPEAFRPVDLGMGDVRSLAWAFVRLDVTYRDAAPETVDAPAPVEPEEVTGPEPTSAHAEAEPAASAGLEALEWSEEPAHPVEAEPYAAIHAEPGHTLEEQPSAAMGGPESAQPLFREEPLVEIPHSPPGYSIGAAPEAEEYEPRLEHGAWDAAGSPFHEPLLQPETAPEPPNPFQDPKMQPGEKRAGLGRFFSRLFGG